MHSAASIIALMAESDEQFAALIEEAHQSALHAADTQPEADEDHGVAERREPEHAS